MRLVNLLTATLAWARSRTARRDFKPRRTTEPLDVVAVRPRVFHDAATALDAVHGDFDVSRGDESTPPRDVDGDVEVIFFVSNERCSVSEIAHEKHGAQPKTTHAKTFKRSHMRNVDEVQLHGVHRPSIGKREVLSRESIATSASVPTKSPGSPERGAASPARGTRPPGFCRTFDRLLNVQLFGRRDFPILVLERLERRQHAATTFSLSTSTALKRLTILSGVTRRITSATRRPYRPPDARETRRTPPAIRRRSLISYKIVAVNGVPTSRSRILPNSSVFS